MAAGSSRCRLLAIAGIVFCGLGSALLGTALVRLEALRGATFADCNMVMFQADARRSIVTSEPSCKSQCSFLVQAAFPDGRVNFMVRDFLPAGRHSDRSATGIEWVHPQFSCCPPSMADCCGFRDESSMAFCDNWGSFDKECHKGSWRCHVKDLENVMDEYREVSADLLLMGDAAQPLRQLIAGAIFSLLGVIVLGYLTAFPWLKRLTRKLAFGLPSFMHTSKMQQIVEDVAATEIQRIVRGVQARVLFKDMWANRRKPPSPRRWTLDMIYGPFLAEGKPDVMLEQGLLYDTGSVSTFRRLVRSRIVSAPGDKFERVEVSLDKPAAWLADSFRVGPLTPPVVAQSPPRVFAEVYGVRRGHKLIEVGQLKWPAASGRQLVQGLRMAPRPILLLFEGMPETTKVLHRPENLAGTCIPPPLWKNPPSKKRARVGPEALEPTQALASSISDAQQAPSTKKARAQPESSSTGFACGSTLVCSTGFRGFRRVRFASLVCKDQNGRRAVSVGQGTHGHRRRRSEVGVSPSSSGKSSSRKISPMGRRRRPVFAETWASGFRESAKADNHEAVAEPHIFL